MDSQQYLQNSLPNAAGVDMTQGAAQGRMPRVDAPVGAASGPMGDTDMTQGAATGRMPGVDVTGGADAGQARGPDMTEGAAAGRMPGVAAG